MKALRWPRYSLAEITREVLEFAADHGSCVVTCRGLTISLHAECDPFAHDDTIGTYNQHVNVAHLHADILDAMKLGFNEAQGR